MTDGRPNPPICWPGQAECHDSEFVGGKAAHLSQLSAAFRIPSGFCLTTAAFDHATFDGQVEDVAAQSRGGLTEAVYEALAQAYVQLGQHCGQVAPPVAVRSSAVDEDGISASFAGQHETLLNIAGVEAVAQAVVQCWRSARSVRAQAYRRQQGLAPDMVRLAVLEAVMGRPVDVECAYAAGCLYLLQCRPITALLRE